MHFFNLNKRITSLLFFLWFSGPAFLACAQEQAPAISSGEHQRMLHEFKNKADAFCAKNLNRFGLYELQQYDKALDSLFAKEKEDTLAVLQNNYVINFDHRKAETGDLKSQFDELNKTKEVHSAKYHGLLRKAGIAFAIWLLVVLIILKWRKKLVRKSESELEASMEQLKNSENYMTDGDALFQSAVEWKKKISELEPVEAEMQKTVSAVSEKLNPEAAKSEAFKTLQKNSLAIHSSLNRLGNFCHVLAEQQGEPGTEKVLTNINQLCDQYADVSYSGVPTGDDFPCQLTKDFEKNLPSIKVIPEAVGSLLLNIFDNAFLSVMTKHRKEIKGYVPKVSVSTRVLPRFVQIRIKDNGDGIPDDVMAQAYDAFYTTRIAGEGAGLGLHFSDQIIKENNGELKIESEAGNGTDVYIKFFLQSTR